MTLYLATDHRGLKLKNQLKAWLASKNIDFKDLGAYELDPDDDFPVISKLLVSKVLENPLNRGVIFCGSGAGVSIACNKKAGIRCALGFNHRQISDFVIHDNVNVLAISSDYTKKFKCFQLVKSFLSSKFNGKPRYTKRLEMIEEMEKEK